MRKHKAGEIFGFEKDARRDCCACCVEFCHEHPDSILGSTIWSFDSDGVSYVTDCYVAVRRDMILDAHYPIPITVDAVWEKPQAKPGPSARELSPERMHRLIAAGIDICEGGPGHIAKQYLYVGDEFVGWMQIARPGNGCSLADFDELALIASDLPVLENEDPWTTAGKLLRWERSRREAARADVEPEMVEDTAG